MLLLGLLLLLLLLATAVSSAVSCSRMPWSSFWLGDGRSTSLAAAAVAGAGS